jgi:hypothetical protein
LPDVFFKPKKPSWVNFRWNCNLRCRYYLWTFGLSTSIWYVS